jgi:hypothetical protein
MAHFRMLCTLQNFAAHNRTYANTRSYRNVKTVLQASRRAPAGLPDCGSVDISVHDDRQIQRSSKFPMDIDVLPVPFRRGFYVPVVSGIPVQLKRPERANANACQFVPIPGSSTKKLYCLTNCGLWLTRSNLSNCLQLIRTQACSTDKFSTACFNATVMLLVCSDFAHSASSPNRTNIIPAKKQEMIDEYTFCMRG